MQFIKKGEEREETNEEKRAQIFDFFYLATVSLFSEHWQWSSDFHRGQSVKHIKCNSQSDLLSAEFQVCKQKDFSSFLRCELWVVTETTDTHTETALEGVFQSCFWWDSDLVYKISFFVLFLNKLSNMIKHIKIRLHGEVFWIWRFFSINHFSLFLGNFFPPFW